MPPPEPCPIEGCNNRCRGEMCTYHWRRVSAGTRAAVWATWKRWKADFSDADAMRAYENARDDARMEARE